MGCVRSGGAFSRRTGCGCARRPGWRRTRGRFAGTGRRGCAGGGGSRLLGEQARGRRKRAAPTGVGSGRLALVAVCSLFAWYPPSPPISILHNLINKPLTGWRFCRILKTKEIICKIFKTLELWFLWSLFFAYGDTSLRLVDSVSTSFNYTRGVKRRAWVRRQGDLPSRAGGRRPTHS